MNRAQRDDLFEEFLPVVQEIASEFDDDLMPEEDLVQEGYVGLLKGLERLQEEEDNWSGVSLDETLRTSIRDAIREARDEYAELGRRDLRLVAQAELLSQSIDRLTEELGTKPNIDEIANDMQISQEKVIDILKLTGDEVNEDALRVPGSRQE